MMLWLAIALMTGTAVFAVLWPLARRGPLRSGSDLAVYRDQLEEIERDSKAGRIGEREAEAARVEVSRRLIAAADAAAATPAPGAGALWRRRASAVATLLMLPAGALGLYLALGSPNLPGRQQPAPSAIALEDRPVVELVARIEAHLEQNPEDARGWEVLGPVYMRLGRYDDAVRARRNVLRLLDPNAQREADLGEALTGAASGVVTADAKAAFERAQRFDPDDFRARYFLGLAAEQDGRPQEAAEAWRKLLAGAPPDASWTGFVRQSLARLDPSAVRAPGPSAADVAAASEMSPEQRADMVRGMVERLAERLKQDGADVEGWLRLVRAYMVMGDKDKARNAVGDARRALASEPDKLRRMDELAKGLGLES